MCCRVELILQRQAIAGRMSAMSVISTSLARMVDAESPELRRKAMVKKRTK